jgi:hypothetical protein
MFLGVKLAVEPFAVSAMALSLITVSGQMVRRNNSIVLALMIPTIREDVQDRVAETAAQQTREERTEYQQTA